VRDDRTHTAFDFRSRPIKACLHRGLPHDSRRKKNARLHNHDLRKHR
jgi:hypothetical protein